MERARQFSVRGENRLLANLADAERQALTGGSARVSFGLKQPLFKPNELIDSVYFPLSGVMSLVIRMADGAAVELATVGNEGFVGVPAFLGAERSPTEAFCQVPGDAIVVPVATFREAMQRPAVHDILSRYTQGYVNQISQSTACNQLHSVQERMCRWLLLTHDRVGSDELTLTQEFLSQMLGVRRPSVTVVAGILQQAKLIEYHRGRIKVLDRKGLEEGACECYRVVRNEYERLLGS